MPRLSQLTFKKILGAGNFGQVSLYENDSNGENMR